MEFESDGEPAFACRQMPGYSGCAKANFNAHQKKGTRRCPSNGTTCVSKYADSKNGNLSIAIVFMANAANSLRYIGHSKHQREKARAAELLKKRQADDAAVEQEIARFSTPHTGDAPKPLAVTHEKRFYSFV